MRIVLGAACTECGKLPAYERWSIDRELKTIERHIFCGQHGKGLAKMKPKTPRHE